MGLAMNRRLSFVPALAVAIGASALRAQAPSQRELNGFLIGQHRDPIAASFTRILQVDTTPDGWVYRTYVLDRSHRAYMSFKFPHDRPDYTVSVQVAGDSGTPMVPFLGLVLGDHRESVLTHLGKPTHITHENDLNLDLYAYDHRNYSVELDSLGRVSSIQILGDDGFANIPTNPVPSLDSLALALQAGGDSALQSLAPDLEIYQGGKTFTFRRAALTELQDDTTRFATLLLHGPNNVATILQNPSTRSTATGSIRVWERAPAGWVWKFPVSVPISEIVYTVGAGRWRVWEIRYR